MKELKIILGIGFIALLTACDLHIETNKLGFGFSDNLLGSSIRNPALGISYSVPAGFVALTDLKEVAKYKEKLPMDGSLTLIAIYLDFQTGSFMVVSEAPFAVWEKFAAFAANAKLSPLSLKWNQVNHTSYGNDDFDTKQWFLRDHEWVNIKMQFKKRQKFFQADYFIPVKIYTPGFSKLVDCSIDSFRSLER